jgi:hypothetical protein
MRISTGEETEALTEDGKNATAVGAGAPPERHGRRWAGSK